MVDAGTARTPGCVREAARAHIFWCSVRLVPRAQLWIRAAPRISAKPAICGVSNELESCRVRTNA